MIGPTFQSLKIVTFALLMLGAVGSSLFALGARISKPKQAEPKEQFIPSNVIPFHDARAKTASKVSR
ncbi:hypothetical protein [Granulicella tundricola]|uniref:Uncharacterized protein n=1 Tax=Granulicella tundricola (strain ATCC BAA-1859 / DSM 23138 / MP5ACTX9) TaxID=1198114 RepID=E8X190_GRATM|nr:hypothetical protein [Granulicella tundricola]ADW69044.1 hypothetical protein AciX9_1999 [Granulicella tundricola MP5ACTX9]